MCTRYYKLAKKCGWFSSWTYVSNEVPTRLRKIKMQNIVLKEYSTVPKMALCHAHTPPSVFSLVIIFQIIGEVAQGPAHG